MTVFESSTTVIKVLLAMQLINSTRVRLLIATQGKHVYANYTANQDGFVDRISRDLNVDGSLEGI